ncbi:hypothetical protein GV829_13915 [Sphingomonas lacunae]|uniref:Uncharacterized protein n=1 Tax=Sphingomonas lacunae TaxID=2698828 RepID=A0A6M4AW79_9SPHN|nr:hypothetical protein [Sphingomonas lacunae]QJQ33393.1 hypothetical protein GV829_13915 [Sphingomonas lacunae]
MTSPQDDIPESAETEENEVLREARRVREQKERAEAKGKLGWKAGAAAAIGVGSAALIAALLYANRDRKD